MPNILKIKNVEKVRKEIQEHISNSVDARFIRRLDVITLVLIGYPARRAASLFGINPTTVQRWVHLANNYGVEALRDKPGRGRPSRLGEANPRKLKKDIQKEPSEFGYDQAI